MTGGLGNQLFQYAAAKNFAIKNNAELIIDTNSGFLINFFYSFFKYYDKFRLNKKKLKKIKFKKIIFFFLLFKILKKLFNANKVFNNILNFIIVNETLLSKVSERIVKIKNNKNIYLLGYFQSEKYFFENKDSIINEIFPLKSKENIFLEMQKKIINCNSVSLAIRLHKISLTDKKPNRFGGIASINFYKKAINDILKKNFNPSFFIFSMNSDDIKNILAHLPILNKYKIHIITCDHGFKDPYDTLWLMSYCKSHIISNSTLYWWGAYFSRVRYKKNKIICSGNFPNKDTCLDEWKLK
jgi:hypothetical protein